MKAITTRPGTGDYDVILEAPFPIIEIMRWKPRDNEIFLKSWFTLDNRRLYCLQRTAVALWPRRAAIPVQVMYAAPEGAFRKSDSSTAGRSVSIGHSLKNLTDKWDWRQAIKAEHLDAAEGLARVDDARETVKDLLDAPAPPSMLELLLRAPKAAAPALAPESSCLSKPAQMELDSPSTRSPSTPRSAAGASGASVSESDDKKGSPSSHGMGAAATLGALLVGTWENDDYEAYEVKAIAKDSWSCSRKDNSGTGGKQIVLWYDDKTDAVCWGKSWTLFADASALRQQPDELRWYAGNDTQMQWPRFTWWKVQQDMKGSKLQRKQQQSYGKSAAKNKKGK
jgi:hypothetical protein